MIKVAYDMTDKIIDQMDDTAWLSKSASMVDTHTTQHFDRPDLPNFALILVRDNHMIPKFPIKTAGDVELSAKYLRQSDLPEELKKIAGYYLCNRAIVLDVPIPDVPRHVEPVSKYAEVFFQAPEEPIKVSADVLETMMTPRDRFLYHAELAKLGHAEPVGVPDLSSRLASWNYHPLAIAESQRALKLAEEGDIPKSLDIVERLDAAFGRPAGVKDPWDSYRRLAKKTQQLSAEIVFNNILGFLHRVMTSEDRTEIGSAFRNIMSEPFYIKFKNSPTIAYAMADEPMKVKIRRFIYRLIKAMNDVDDAMLNDSKKFDEYLQRTFRNEIQIARPAESLREAVPTQAELCRMIAESRSRISD